MPPSAESVQHIQQVLQIYKAQVGTIVATHKKKVKKAIEEVDKRKTQKLLKDLGKIPSSDA